MHGLPGFVGCDCQRWHEPYGIWSNVVDRQSFIEGGLNQVSGDRFVQNGRQQQAPSAYLSDTINPSQQITELRSAGRRVGQQIVALDSGKGGESGLTHHRSIPESRGVVPGLERRGRLFRGQTSPYRETVRQCFGRSRDIRFESDLLPRKSGACAAHPSLYVVDDEENVL